MCQHPAWLRDWHHLARWLQAREPHGQTDSRQNSFPCDPCPIIPRGLQASGFLVQMCPTQQGSRGSHGTLVLAAGGRWPSASWGHSAQGCCLHSIQCPPSVFPGAETRLWAPRHTYYPLSTVHSFLTQASLRELPAGPQAGPGPGALQGVDALSSRSAGGQALQGSPSTRPRVPTPGTGPRVPTPGTGPESPRPAPSRSRAAPAWQSLRASQ